MSVQNCKYFAIHYIVKLLLAVSQHSGEDAWRLLCRYTLEMNFACSRWLAGWLAELVLEACWSDEYLRYRARISHLWG